MTTDHSVAPGDCTEKSRAAGFVLVNDRNRHMLSAQEPAH
jgi:hypothetical protein